MQTETSSGSESFRVLLGSVVSRNGSKWLRFILTILRNQADAEDVLQEAIRRVLSRNVSIQSEDQIRMYVGRAIANAALELFNNRKRERLRRQALSEQSAFMRKHTTPASRIEERERKREEERLLGFLDEGLKQLPAKQYEALRLTILEAGDHSIRDVGSMNGIPYSTLRHRSKKGLTQLRKFIIARGKEKRSQEAGVRSQNENQAG
jgi:RNA polymerase sigma factor (sigma-70 family)